MPGLTAPQFTEVVTAPLFASRLVEVTTYTGDFDAEAGFAVYHTPGGNVEISRVVHADTEYLEAVEDFAPHPAYTPPQKLGHIADAIRDSDTPAVSTPYVDLGRLIATDGDKLRTDLAIVAHSHPLTHEGRRSLVPQIRRLVMPSASDLLNFADHAAANPGLVAATAAAHTKLGGIAFFPWRVGAPDTIQRIQAEVEPPTETQPVGTVIDEAKMTALGLHFTTITFHRQTGAPVKGMGSIATKLFA